MEKRSQNTTLSGWLCFPGRYCYGNPKLPAGQLWKNTALVAICTISLLIPHPTHALSEGELRFTVNGKTYTTQHAVAALQTKGDKTRIMIAVKDVEQRFLLILTADVPRGDEQRALRLNTQDAALGLTLRTPQGAFAVIPNVQLAKPTNDTYTVQVMKETEEWEDDPTVPESALNERRQNRKRRKIRSEYQRVKPAWHSMTPEQRRQRGEGVIANHAFDDTYFTLTLTPIIEAGRVISYEGNFSGTARFSQSISGAEVVPVKNGAFRVRVQHAP